MERKREGQSRTPGILNLLAPCPKVASKAFPWLTPAKHPSELERVPNKLLKPSMDCPICSNPFLDGKSPTPLPQSPSIPNPPSCPFHPQSPPLFLCINPKKTHLTNPPLTDEYPLVVRLPCNKNHLFDLECIAPWLKLHATCPLDRKDLVQEKKPPPPIPPLPRGAEEEEEEWDDMYA